MAIRNDIIGRATDELIIVDRQLLQLPNLISKIQLNLDDLIVPATNFDQRVCELTQAVNLKVKEFEVLTTLISSTCGKTVDHPDPDVNMPLPVGIVYQFDVVQGFRNDSEDTNYSGNNPFSTTVFGATTNMMGGGDFENIITGNLGVGVTTIIGVGRTFFAQESDATKEVGDSTVDCKIVDGDSYDNVYDDNGSGGNYVGNTYTARRTALLGEIQALRETRNNYMNDTVNELKKEIKFKYTQRHTYYYGISESNRRKTELENIINMANDPVNISFYSCLLYTSPSPRDS